MYASARNTGIPINPRADCVERWVHGSLQHNRIPISARLLSPCIDLLTIDDVEKLAGVFIDQHEGKGEIGRLRPQIAVAVQAPDISLGAGLYDEFRIRQSLQVGARVAALRLGGHGDIGQ